jgi:ubiquitin-like protein ATG12
MQQLEWFLANQPTINEDVLNALEAYRKKDTNKSAHTGAEQLVRSIANLHLVVIVRFKGVGNAPIMKQNMYKISALNRFQAVIQFLRKELGWPAGEPLVRVPITIKHVPLF